MEQIKIISSVWGLSVAQRGAERFVERYNILNRCRQFIRPVETYIKRIDEGAVVMVDYVLETISRIATSTPLLIMRPQQEWIVVTEEDTIPSSS